MAGALVGFAIGTVGSLVMPFPTYAKGLGVAIVVIAGLGLLSAGVDWLTGDRPTRVSGKLVSLDYEVRLPNGASWPPAPDTVDSEPRVFLARDTKTLGSYGLNLSEATHVDGR